MKNRNEILNLAGKKVLIIRLSSLGDILLTTPFLRTLKSKYHGIKLDFILKKQYRDALLNNPNISELYFYEKDKKYIEKLISDLIKEDYDIVIDLQNNFRSSAITRALNIGTYRFNKRILDKFLLVKFKINNLKHAPPVPVRYASTLPDFDLDEEGLELLSPNHPAGLIGGKNKLIGFAPGSRHYTKMWPKEYFQRLGNFLVESGYNVVLFGGKDDIPVCSVISGQIPGSINLCGEDDLLQTAVDMKQCRVVVCNDSGMMHTACAMKIPVLAIWGSSVKEFGFTPYKNNNLILENNSLTCRPCSHIGRERCPKGHFKCMLETGPEKTYEALMKFLEN